MEDSAALHSFSEIFDILLNYRILVCQLIFLHQGLT